MPEYHMPFGSDAAVTQFVTLDSFTQGYITAMFFTETVHENDLKGAEFAELHPDSLVKIVAECAEFQHSFAEQIDVAKEVPGYDDERAGNDFWLTRNRHGAGFWDRGLSHAGDYLTKMSHAYGELHLCRGDDGMIHVE